MKKILKLQKLSVTNPSTGGGGINSRASLLLCGNSSLSVTTCN